MRFPKLKSKAILAPMSGVTDVAFRSLAMRCGAGLTYTEFVSAAALARKNEKTWRILETNKEQKPVGTQIFGSNVNEAAAAGKMLESKFDIIDFNCGCSEQKITKTGAGSELLKKPSLIYDMENFEKS